MAGSLTAEQARRISLIEVLLEDLRERLPGLQLEGPPEEEAVHWSETQILGWFADQERLNRSQHQHQHQQHQHEQQHQQPPLQATHTAAPQGQLVSLAEASEQSANPAPPSCPDSKHPSRNKPSAAPAPPSATPLPLLMPTDAQLFAKWFPGLERSRTATATPRLRVVALHSAGNSEDMWTAEGTGPRRAPSPLLVWCRANGVELLAAQLPGRGARRGEPCYTTAQDAAQGLLSALAGPLASGVPYVLLSHSMGCWVGLELLRLASSHGLPLPRCWCLSAMPHPDVEESRRPWRRNRGLGDGDFREEVRGWDVNEVLFDDGMWQVYEPLLRADFTIFDEYVHQPLQPSSKRSPAVAGSARPEAESQPWGPSTLQEQQRGQHGEQLQQQPQQQHGDTDASPASASAPFGFPITAFYGTEDRRVTGALVGPWRHFTCGPFALHPVHGNHMWPLNNKDAKAAWLQTVVQAFDSVLATAFR